MTTVRMYDGGKLGRAVDTYVEFVSDRLVFHPTLVCPLMVLWRGYVRYCGDRDFHPVLSHVFVRWVLKEEGVTVSDGGTGRLRRCVHGVGFKQETD